MAIGWLLLIVLGVSLAVGVALASVLLGNRHTRGVTKTLLAVAALSVGAVALWLVNRVPTHAVEATASPRQQALAQQHLSFAEVLEREGSEDARQLAQAHRREASNILLQPETAYHSATARSSRFGFTVFSPILLLPFLVLLFLLFKHGGPGLGLAALAIPLVFLFFGYASFEQRSGHTASSAPDARSIDEAAFAQRMRLATEPVGDIALPVDEVVGSESRGATTIDTVAEVDDAAVFETISGVTPASAAEPPADLPGEQAGDVDPIGGPAPTPPPTCPTG